MGASHNFVRPGNLRTGLVVHLAILPVPVVLHIGRFPLATVGLLDHDWNLADGVFLDWSDYVQHRSSRIVMESPLGDVQKPPSRDD